MDLLRENKIPALYLTIPWIRKSEVCTWADCLEDIDLITQMKNVCNGKLCISSFDSRSEFIIKAVFPDNWNQFSGTSEGLIQWNYFYWKVWDVLYLIEDNAPYEAVVLSEANIPFDYLESIESRQSCIPLLKKLKKIIDYGDLTAKDLFCIDKLERKLFEEIDFKKMKGSASSYMLNTKKKENYIDKKISLKLRKEILRRDNYQCVFCGATSQNAVLEVDHVIPKSLIKKMCLRESLHNDSINLCTTCLRCNREKSDLLKPIDIIHYMNRFSNKDHPNHEILQYLEKIKDMQIF